MFDCVCQDIGEYMFGQIQDCFDYQQFWDGLVMLQLCVVIVCGGKMLIDMIWFYKSYVYCLVSGGFEIGSNVVYVCIQYEGGDVGCDYLVYIDVWFVFGVNECDVNVIGDMLFDVVRMM